MASKKWDDDFDPHAERRNENGLTRCEGITNVIKGCLGTGVLALPEAFYLAGTYNGIVLFLLLSLFGTYCFHLNLHAQYLLCKIKKTGFLTYANALQTALQVGPSCMQRMAGCAGPFVDAIMIIYQTGTLCVYIIFMGANLKMVCDQYFEPKHIAMFILYTFPPVLVLCFVPNIKWFTPLSMLANIVTVVALGVIAYYVSFDLQDWNSLPYIGDWQNFPIFFGTAVFALLSVPIIISVENNMKDPSFFVAPFGALNIGFGLVVFLYVIVGIMGYWRYGDKIESSITLNFPADEVLAQIIRALYVVAIWITYGFNSLVPHDILWYTYILPKFSEDASSTKKWAVDYIVRLCIVIVTYVISVLIPLLGPVISLTGGVCLSLLGIILPAFMEFCALWPDNFGTAKWILYKDIIIFLIGIFGLVSNMYASIRDIVSILSIK